MGYRQAVRCKIVVVHGGYSAKATIDVYLIRPINGTAMKKENSLPLVSTNG